MGTHRSQIEDLLFKSVVALTLFVLAIYSIKTVLSDCTIFSKVNCQSEQSEIISIEKEISRIKQQISSVKDRQSLLECKEIDTASSSDSQSTKIDTSLWAQGNLKVLNGCWNLDWDYTLREAGTNKIVRVTSWDVCFKSGSEIGVQTLLFEDGANCIEQPIRGEFKNINDQSKLYLDDSKDVDCNLGRVVFQRRMECELIQNADYAECAISTLQRDGSWSDFQANGVRLSRKRN